VVGATTRAGMLTNPLRDRFGIVARLEFYTRRKLAFIVSRSASARRRDRRRRRLRIARRARGTPRIANRLLRRVRDYAQVKADGDITAKVADAGAPDARRRSPGARSDGPQAARRNAGEVRRRPGRARQPRAAIGESSDTIETCGTYLIQQGYCSARRAARRHRVDLADFGLAHPRAAVTTAISSGV